MDQQTATARLSVLRNILAARTTSEGQPKPGYKRNVADIRAEIAKTEKALANDTPAT